MAVIKNGTGLVWGSDNLTFTGVVINSGTTGHVQSYDFRRESDMEELRDGDGNVIGAAFYNDSKTLTVTCIPADVATPTIAGAEDNMNAMIVQPGTVVTVVDAENGTGAIETSNSGKYVLLDIGINRTNRSMATVSMTIKQWVDNDVAVAIS